ncbi:allantoinase [Evansella caseinilytica]|uniref:Allantoinase n=1 Tax=Evansella caseinilytica TaxID=1503961 RepID=A0A1H3HSY0_9BACI|nr:allantoinase AllB [Evansella caseinilytica]SDY18335.1 allantoinase [Evansella caseinilytica]
MKQLLLKNGRVFIEPFFADVHLAVTNGVITGLTLHGEALDESAFEAVIDASGCYVFPGFIDAHVHFNDPGREEWEGFLTGSLAAAAGGITTVFDMPLNSLPSVVNAAVLEEKRTSVQDNSFIDYRFWGGVTADNVAREQELEEMKAAGVAGFKGFLAESGIDDFPFLRKEQWRQALLAAKKLRLVLALHAEDQALIEAKAAKLFQARRTGAEAYLASRPPEAEISAIDCALQLTAETGAAVHFVHVSTAVGAGLIHQAKQNGLDVTAEICPHYLLLDEADFKKRGAVCKCAPPLRSRMEVEALWQCIARGLADTIGSDHSPCPLSMKTAGDIWVAWGGIQGIQHGFVLFLNEAKRRGIPLEQVLPLLTSNPAKRFGLLGKKGAVSIGADGDFTIYDPASKWKVETPQLLTRHRYTPYENIETTGEIVTTIVRGNVVYQKDGGEVKLREGKEIAAGGMSSKAAER